MFTIFSKFINCLVISSVLFVCLKFSSDSIAAEHDNKDIATTIKHHLVFLETNTTFLGGIDFVRGINLSPVLLTKIRSFYDPADLQRFDCVIEVTSYDEKELAEALAAAKLDVKGVISPYDDTILPASRLAERLGLPHADTNGLENVYSKYEVRRILKEAGKKQPEFMLFDFAKLPTSAPMTYPFVIKPSHDAGAAGVYFVRSEAEYKEALTALQSQRATFTGTDRVGLLYEAFVSGDFYGAEFFWDSGKWRLIDINQIIIDPSKSLCMDGIASPAPSLTEGNVRMIGEEITDWLEIVGLHGGSVNVEFKMVDARPILIEINPRLAGARVSKLVSFSRRVSPLELLILSASGNADQATTLLGSMSESTGAYYVNYFLFSPFLQVKGIDTSVLSRDGLLHLDCREAPVQLSGKREFDNILCEFITMGSTYKEALDRAQSVIASIKIDGI